MHDDEVRSKVSRREFIGTSAAAAGGLVSIGPAMAAEPARPQASFVSPAGSRIPFSRAELFASGATRVFEGRYLNEIAFPLGGIGTGTVSLGGRGQLRDWEIFNRPGKGKNPPYTFTSIYAKKAGGQPVARVLESQLLPSFSVGAGMPPDQLCGLPRLRRATF